jgi:hypothetical protein
MGELVDFMVACRVLSTSGSGNETRYEINPAAPLPSEVLPLSDEERADEDRRRWAELHEPAAQKIIGLFHEGEANTERRQTSLQRLAREIGMDVESARAGVLNLLQDGDFTATVNVLRNDAWRESLAGLSDRETGEALADLLDVLADHVTDLDAAVRWQAGDGAKLVTGRPMAAPTVRRTRRR